MLTSQEVKDAACKLGLDGLKITGPEPFSDFARDVRRRVEGGSISTDLLEAKRVLSEAGRLSDPLVLLPTARSVISISIGYLEEQQEDASADGPRGQVARFLWRDHLAELSERRGQLVRWLERKGAACSGEVALPHKAVAARAGLGSFGKNSNIQALDQGSWCLLSSIVTDADLERDEPMGARCGSCRRCIGACPTKAIVEPYIIDANRCINHLLASSLAIPPELREKVGDRVSGCDVCQEVCPRNWYVVPRVRERAPMGSRRPELLRLLEVDEREFNARYSRWEWYEPRAALLRRNAAVALGNSRAEGAVPYLAQRLKDPEKIVRSHSAWALGKLGGHDAAEALQEARRVEKDGGVLDEMEYALALLR